MVGCEAWASGSGCSMCAGSLRWEVDWLVLCMGTEWRWAVRLEPAAADGSGVLAAISRVACMEVDWLCMGTEWR